MNFDDLSGAGSVADGYGGIKWAGNWRYYGFTQDPYNPASAPNRIYRDDTPVGDGLASIPFYFTTPAVFNGAAIAGYNFAPVTFDLFLDGVLVHSSSVFVPTSTATFHGSGYAGLVDKVRFTSSNFVVFDDVTYNATAVPEPATWGMMILGFGVVGAASRYRRRATRVAFAV